MDCEATLVLLVACNDPRTGMDTGHCDAIHVLPNWHDEPLMELEGGPWRCVVIAGFLRLGRIALPVITSRAWVGNWCWDGYEVPIDSAACLLAALCASPSWRIDEAYTPLYDAWHKQEQSAERWQTLLAEELL